MNGERQPKVSLKLPEIIGLYHLLNLAFLSLCFCFLPFSLSQYIYIYIYIYIYMLCVGVFWYLFCRVSSMIMDYMQ